MAVLCGGKVYQLRFLPVGLNALIEDGPCSKWDRIRIYTSGPLINFLLSGLGFLLNSYYLFAPDSMRFFILINASLFIFNMIPILPMDGGRILREALSLKLGMFLAGRYTRSISRLLSLFLIMVGAVQIFYNVRNFSLILIGIYIFFTLKYEERETALMNVKNMIYRRSRLLNKGIYPARDLVVLKSLHLGEIIKAMDFDRFHIIHVLDDDLKVVRVMTEHEVIEAMLKYNAEITFDELLKLIV